MNAESHKWWDDFLKTFKDVHGTVNADLPPWPLDALQSAAKPSSTKEVSVPMVILNHHQSEKEIPCEVMALIIANILVCLCVVYYVTGSKNRDHCTIFLKYL